MSKFRSPLTDRRPSCACASGSELRRVRGLSFDTSEAANSTPSEFARDAMTARVEAILFVAREPLTSRKIAQLGNLSDGTEARTTIRRLNKLYDASGSAFRVEELAGGYQLFTRPQFGPWLRKSLSVATETRLSGPAQETLAVVAYRQPIPRAEIEAVRGVQCGDLLRQLLERDLIRIAGRADDLGRPLLYGTTKRFLQIFGLRHLDELPRAEQLRKRPEPVSADQRPQSGSKSTQRGRESEVSVPEHSEPHPLTEHVRFHEEELR